MKTFLTIAALSWTALWFTPDQQGQRLFDKREFKAASSHFSDPMRKGIALYRAGELKQAELTTPSSDGDTEPAELDQIRPEVLSFLAMFGRLCEGRPEA